MKPLSLCIPVLLACSAAAHAQSAREWEAKFNSAKPEVRRQAYEGLAGNETAIRALEKVQARRIRDLQGRIKRLSGSLPGERVLSPWLKARKAAEDIIFDTVQYPTPADRHAAGPEKGYDLVKPRLDAALKAYAPVGQYANRACQAVRAGKWNRSLDGVRTSIEAVREAEEALAEAKKDHEPAEVPSLDFFDALVLLGKNKFREAAELYGGGKLTATQKIQYFLILACLIDHYNNHVIRHGMDRKSMQAVNRINHIRTALGVLPYEVDPILSKCIRDHMADIDSGKTPFGHMSNVPGKRSVRDRATRAGWKGGAHENLSRGGPMESVNEGWFWDGGHGRNQVSPKHDKIGFAVGNQGCGFNNGYGGDLVVPRVASPF